MDKALEQRTEGKRIAKRHSDITMETIGNKEEIEKRYVWGWEDSMAVASSVWGSIHASLLSGDLVFAYRPLGKDENRRLLQLVVVHNFHIDTSGMQDIKVYDDYAVGFITSGYTALLPHVPLRYLKEELSGYLEDWKVSKEILNTYKAIIEDLENIENGKQ